MTEDITIALSGKVEIRMLSEINHGVFVVVAQYSTFNSFLSVRVYTTPTVSLPG